MEAVLLILNSNYIFLGSEVRGWVPLWPMCMPCTSGGSRAGRWLWLSTELSCISSRGLQYTIGTISRLATSVSLYIPLPSLISRPVLVLAGEQFPCCRRQGPLRVVCSLLKTWPLGLWHPSTDLHLPRLFPILFRTCLHYSLSIQTTIFLLTPL